MEHIIAYTYMGARDLYNGCPNLKGAVVVDVVPDPKEEYSTTIVLKGVNGNEYKITIKHNWS